jgi:hypothetical protein
VSVDITTAGVIQLSRRIPLTGISEAGTITLTSTLFQQFGRIEGPLSSTFPPGAVTPSIDSTTGVVTLSMDNKLADSSDSQTGIFVLKVIAQ